MNWTTFKAVLHRVVQGCLANPATVTSAVVVPFPLVSGDTLTFTVDDVGFIYVSALDLPTATAAQIVAQLNVTLPGAWTETLDDRVRLTSTLYGPRGSVQIVGGSLNNALGFALTEQDGTGIADTMVVWEDEAQPFIAESIIKLDQIADRTIGVGEQVKTDVGDALALLMSEQKITTIQIKAESFTHEGARNSFAWLSAIRSRIRNTRAQALMRAHGIVLVDATDVLKVPNFEVDDRKFSAAVLD